MTEPTLLVNLEENMRVIMKCTVIQHYQGWRIDIILQ